MRLRSILSCLTILLFAGTASADGIPIDPGMWEMTSTMTMSMMPAPQTNTVKECIEEDLLNPEQFNMDEESPCDVTDVQVNGNLASWSIVCPTEGGPAMEGKWEITSHGDTLTGKGQMTAEFSGQKMGFDMAWEGKRLGDCE